MTIEEVLARIQNISIDETKEKEYYYQLKCSHIYPHKLNFSSYKHFIPIVLAFNHTPSTELLIRNLAIKLMFAFGTTDETIAYLKRYFKDRQSFCLFNACAFELPSENWQVKLWQQLIIHHQPNNPEEIIFRLFIYANHIEEYFQKNKDEMLNDIKAYVVQEFEKKFATKFVLASLSKEQWLEQQFQQKHKAIERKINHQFDQYLKRKKPSEQDLLFKKILNKQIMANYNEKFTESYDKFEHTTLSKEEYIAKELAASQHEIDDMIAQQTAYLIFPKISLHTLFLAAASHIYPRANENLPAAELFFKFKQLNNTFEHYLSLKPKDDPKRIPNIFIDGKTIAKEYEPYYLAKLSSFDPRAALLGFYTCCCQLLSDLNGCGPTVHGITSAHGGFYVIFKKKPDWKNPNSEDLIISQCWAWNANKNLVFDSVETHKKYKNNLLMISDFFTLLTEQLVKDHSFSQVLVGVDDVCQTPPELGACLYTQSLHPHNYQKKYRDSEELRLIASKTNPSLIEIYKSNNPKSALNKKLLLLSSSAAFFSEKNIVEQDANCIENINRFVSS